VEQSTDTDREGASVMSTDMPDHSGEIMTRPASYAIGLLHEVQPGAELADYLTGIDATLQPFGGSFLVHGGSPQVMEGSLTCDLIVIGFPAADGAQRWYHSPAYQQLAVLRRTFAQGSVILCRGEDSDHRALDILTRSEVKS